MDNTASSISSQSWGFIDLAITRLASVKSIFLIVFLFVSVFVLKSKGTNKNKNNRAVLPPGPTPCPIVGSIHQIIFKKNKPTFRWIHALMKEMKTDIACIKLANTHVIPVTSPEIAREFLKKHDSLFSSRPVTMATEYSSRGFLSIALVPWGDQWKKMRKVVASEILTSSRLRWLLGKRNEEADNLITFIYNQCKISNNDDDEAAAVVDLRLAMREYCGNVIRKMVFNKRYFGEGRKDGGPGDEEVAHVESLFTVLNHAYSFALSDYVPWLRVLDLDGHEKIVSEAMRIVNGFHDPLIDDRVLEWTQGKRKEADDLLDVFILAKDSNGKPALSVEEIKAQCAELMLATVDNPSNAAEWAMAEMINKFEILEKACQEIDSVVGKDRLVQEADLPKLNYVKACLREAYRLHPIAPFNLPHVSSEDAVVAGYFIPKGSHVLLSRVGLGRNPQVWDDPLEFKPERHLMTKDGSKTSEVDLTETELRFITFTTGRRGCMGVSLGTEMSVMMFARLIHCFSWSVPPNEDKIDLSESDDLFLVKPLHLLAKPRLPSKLY